MLKKTLLAALASATMTLGTTFVFGAAQAADVNMRVLGWYGNQPQSTKLERPFWENIEKSSNGMFSANFKTVDEIGLKGFEALRTLRSGAFDVVSFQISFVGGEAPVLMGADLPSAAGDFDQLHKLVDAYRPVMDANLQSQFDGKLLAAWTYPFQILFCREPVKSLADLKGKKVRVAGTLSSELVSKLGGTAVTLAGPEVYQAMMQGVVDCGVTGAQYANANGWYEVAKSLVDLPIGGAGVVLHVANKKFWDKLTTEQQADLTKQMGGLEADLWALAADGHADGIRCNIGVEPCGGRLGKMTAAEISDADRAELKDILKTDLLPMWDKECNAVDPNCGANWMKTAAPVAGVTN